ncbi:hypothetical protein CTAM01_08555 [Colletotrichum tamarilloi]|uniref:Secreted protein n=1 Tax=Colletotrichum tamarilloi TaxID=1209934 RepID=A0ABQ9R5S9_9PEZI|nr:uncharacterized protein CTAM01_08555 [Colletotrichum tamarilloi]KAK1495426.1 hypothetical protein CTAM01_08555 [Colletotrichum tamarilloi]
MISLLGCLLISLGVFRRPSQGKGGSSESFLDTGLTDFPVPSTGLPTPTPNKETFPRIGGWRDALRSSSSQLIRAFVYI